METGTVATRSFVFFLCNVPLLAKDETYGSFPVMHFQSSGFFMSLATVSQYM